MERDPCLWKGILLQENKCWMSNIVPVHDIDPAIRIL
jgi:hypothetical protein